MLRLEFDRGTLLVDPGPDGLPPGLTLPGCVFDRRVGRFRAPAQRYREVLTALHRSGIEHDNRAGGFEPLKLRSRLVREPFPYQTEAVEEWWKWRRAASAVCVGVCSKRQAAAHWSRPYSPTRWDDRSRLRRRRMHGAC